MIGAERKDSYIFLLIAYKNVHKDVLYDDFKEITKCYENPRNIFGWSSIYTLINYYYTNK